MADSCIIADSINYAEATSMIKNETPFEFEARFATSYIFDKHTMSTDVRWTTTNFRIAPRDEKVS